MSSPTNSFLILQLTLMASNIMKNEMQLIPQEKRIDIALFSRTLFTTYSHVFISGYNLLKSNQPNINTHRGAAIYIKSSLLYQTLPKFCQPNLQSCSILIPLNNIPTEIAAIYSPPRHNMNIQNYVDYFSIFNHNFIAGGDYYAKDHS